ncbi:OsmC family protein [Vibrio diazotrophicus]|uniref:OsmC family protein n=1 Tax=Vibrio diazotrophicus TaxID=685 RepID=UPI000C9E5C60|nr:OsmC family protein [Vibrio diazotrophicus]PNH93856.1 hypothetical protein C1M59_03765 [Vibrio diazotrophicus]
MAIKMKPASYGPVIVRMNNEGVLQFATLDSEFTSTPSLDSPAMTLLYSIASCMVLSLQMVAKRQKIELEPFTFEVICHKGEDLPAHFSRYEIALSRSVHSDLEVAKKLLKDAKAICTISNSMAGTFELSIKD